jgi:hypothetical protein
MNEKEKANELVRMYKGFSCKPCFGSESDLITAKQCATICVDEIIKSFVDGVEFHRYGSVKYYERVKQEIEKL